MILSECSRLNRVGVGCWSGDATFAVLGGERVRGSARGSETLVSLQAPLG